MEECIFCKIAKGEIQADKVYEDEDYVAFHDIKPAAPFHLLLIPKRHIESIDTLEHGDKELIGGIVLLAQKIAREHGKKGYKLAFNVGREGGQVVDHIHLHLLAQ